MKTILATLGVCLVATGCASVDAPLPAGISAGRFVTMSCAENKQFQVRLSESGKTVRVRGHHGSAELDARSDGVFEGEGYRLRTRGEGAVSLEHDGKSQGKACKAAS
jgi:hypothetical protein